jgi:formylglycine-generating enzyme required for sulfatase activity
VKLSGAEQLPPAYSRSGDAVKLLNGIGYRLPTEAEWEYACRAGTVTRFCAGDTDDDLLRVGYFRQNAQGRTYAVGDLKANSFGLYDMHGNVTEWVQDSWDPRHYQRFANRTVRDAGNSLNESRYRVRRGGMWHQLATYCRSSMRDHSSANGATQGTGMRLVIDVRGVRMLLAKQAAKSGEKTE